MAVVELAASLLDLVIKLIGKDDARKLLDDRAIALANAAADAAEALKFGGGGGSNAD